MIKENDIIYIQVVNRKIVIHTMDEEINGSLTKQIEQILSNFGFEKADSSKFVNTSKILLRDKKLKIIYFDAEKTRYCSITRPNLKKFFW